MGDNFDLVSMATSLIMFMCATAILFSGSHCLINTLNTALETVESDMEEISKQPENTEQSGELTAGSWDGESQFTLSSEESEIAETFLFDENFVFEENIRVDFDMKEALRKATSLYEKSNCQYYFVSIPTGILNEREAQGKSDKYFRRHFRDIPNACVEIVTDNGVFWYYGEYTKDVFTLEELLSLDDEFANVYRVSNYDRKGALTASIIAFVVLFASLFATIKFVPEAILGIKEIRRKEIRRTELMQD